MGLSTFLGGISSKIKIKYLLPDVGSAVKLNGQWCKRFWSSQLIFIAVSRSEHESTIKTDISYFLLK